MNEEARAGAIRRTQGERGGPTQSDKFYETPRQRCKRSGADTEGDASMRNRIYIIAALVTAMILLPMEAASAASCEKPCVVELTATTREKGWRSPVLFGDSTELLISAFTAEGRIKKSLRDEGCTAIFRGHGIYARVKVCGHGPVPIRMRYRASRKPVRFQLVYLAQPL